MQCTARSLVSGLASFRTEELTPGQPVTTNSLQQQDATRTEISRIVLPEVSNTGQLIRPTTMGLRKRAAAGETADAEMDESDGLVKGGRRQRTLRHTVNPFKNDTVTTRPGWWLCVISPSIFLGERWGIDSQCVSAVTPQPTRSSLPACRRLCADNQPLTHSLLQGG